MISHAFPFQVSDVSPQTEAPSGLALRLVLDYLRAEDVVSCGQVCRYWRLVDQGDDVWMSPRLRVISLSRYAADVSAETSSNHSAGGTRIGRPLLLSWTLKIFWKALLMS